MPILVRNIKLYPDEPETLLKSKAAAALNLPQDAICSLSVFRSSLDARRRDEIHYNYSVEVSLDGKTEQKVLREGKAESIPDSVPQEVRFGGQTIRGRVAIVGMGPCGLFAALTLARAGFNPLILERGKPVQQRTEDVEGFWKLGKLDPESNVLFGAGGAGTFSDGKLTARSKDPLCSEVLHSLVGFGAEPEITVQSKPHIGTDILRTVVQAMCNEIESLGGEIRFRTKLTDIKFERDRLTGISITTEHTTENIQCEACILATGHSARDTYRMLLDKGVSLAAKPFAVGARIEHPQALIDSAQFGKLAGHPRLGAAEYALTARTRTGRGVYTFCMCPGGVVVASSSQEGEVVTNGMSYSMRAGENANSAVVVQVGPEDFQPGPLGGIEFQLKLEHKAFEAGGGGYIAPAERLEDFLKKSKNPKMSGEVKPSYLPGVKMTDLWSCLPETIAGGILDGLSDFAGKLKGFGFPDAIITAVESRTSSPVRILRSETGEANIQGIYPAGEGSGYSGGIVSSAVDGIKAARRIISKYKP